MEYILPIIIGFIIGSTSTFIVGTAVFFATQILTEDNKYELFQEITNRLKDSEPEQTPKKEKRNYGKRKRKNQARPENE
jgi:hypothetical protein